MSVLDKKTVDGMALDQDRNCLRLLISDHLDWSNEYNHLVALQEKINAYIDFCEERQYCQVYPNAMITYAVFEIHFQHEPTKRAWNFLEQVQRQVNEMGITLECHILGA